MRVISEAVTDRPPIPGEDEMLPEVELITSPYVHRARIRRDTIRGVVQVTTWLRRYAARSSDRVEPFQLKHSEILVCDGAVVERGTYGASNLPGPGLGSRSARVRQSYLALWRPDNDQWRLERLYLSPDRLVRPGRLAGGCRSAPTALRDVSLGAALGAGQASTFEDAAALLDDVGRVRSEPASLQPRVRLWARLRTQNGVFLTAEFTDFFGMRLESTDTAYYYNAERSVDFTVRLRTLSVLAEKEIGRLGLAAGPIVALGSARTEVSAEGRSRTPHDVTQSIGHIGGTLRVSGRFPLGAHLRTVAAVGYAFFPAYGLTDGLQTTLDFSGPEAFLGLEWVP